MEKPILYFIDIGNSMFSQMAEGIARYYLEEYYIFSAGVDKHSIDSRAVKAMENINIDITDQTSKLIDMELLMNADSMITLSKEAELQCPKPRDVNQFYWRFPEPYNLEGSREEKWQAITKARDQLERLIRQFKDKKIS
ncbi:arsenate reductase ArsC [Tuberibacillus sp. Marseille-P3662]|uniref:arsenate reductase ArsC n=1 Tax=Tuberibacillus sp. Marseille-P3662 TaxID=1965358 RepID=UPI000A1CCF7C|nr:arsenate reductase ArsC [Tuberibacillus sp. Marseille-P3662]